jgi:hypothetical protein
MSAIRPILDLQFGVANTEMGVIQAPEPRSRIMRYELADFEWTAIRPFLPNKPRGMQCRRVVTRYDKLAANYLAFIKLAAIRIWLRAYESTP